MHALAPEPTLSPVSPRVVHGTQEATRIPLAQPVQPGGPLAVPMPNPVGGLADGLVNRQQGKQ